MKWSDIIGFFKGFLKAAPKLAETAALVAEATGNDEVIGDINKAGNAARIIGAEIKDGPV